jgi:hypothetical protein
MRELLAECSEYFARKHTAHDLRARIDAVLSPGGSEQAERRTVQRRSEPRAEHVEEVGKIVDRALIRPSGAVSGRRSTDTLADLP